jgi:hypothetical protein
LDVADTLAPPPLVREGEFVPARDEDDEVIVHRSPLLELGNPEIDETPASPLVVLPEGIHEPRDIPPVPALVRSIGQRYAGRVIPRDQSRDEMIPRPKTLAQPLQAPYTVIGKQSTSLLIVVVFGCPKGGREIACPFLL